MIYLPGKPIKELPDGFTDWLQLWVDLQSNDVLPDDTYGIYNPTGGTFIGKK